MKIAITCEDGNVFQHFGHTPGFAVFETDENTIISETLLDSGSSGHGALAAVLKDASVDVLICGGIGGGAINALTKAGIRVIGGASGTFGDKVYFCGSLDRHPDGEAIKEFCRKHKKTAVSLSNGNLQDVGSLFFIGE